MASVLVVDDERSILKAVGAGLAARGYDVRTAATGDEALSGMATDPPDVVILDLGLPDLDGVEVTRRARQWTGVPILVLSAAGSDERKVAALDAGADDYVTKPFSMPELLARVRVALRHAHTESAPSSVLTVGDVEVDVAEHRVTVGGQVVALTRKEFDFLALLARWPGRVLTHRMILQEVWGPEYGTETQYLRVYASQLRKKLDEDPARPRLITEAGVGFRLVNRDDDDG